MTTLLAALPLLLWVYLAAGRGGFWHAAERDGGGPLPEAWPRVIAVIPARDEAEGIGQTVRSLLLQDYPGSLSIILVDDESSDGTADFAERARIKLGEGVTGQAAQLRKAVLVNDVIQDPSYIAAVPSVCSELAVPLEVMGTVRGVLNVNSDRLEAFSPADQEMLEAGSWQQMPNCRTDRHASRNDRYHD